LEKEKSSEDWETAIIRPIHKKGDREIYNNYRGIALLKVIYEILSNCVLEKVRPWAENPLEDCQAGFRKNKSTTD